MIFSSTFVASHSCTATIFIHQPFSLYSQYYFCSEKFFQNYRIAFYFFWKICFRTYFCRGGMSERFNEAVLKTVDPKGPGVRIPLPPLKVFQTYLKARKMQILRAFFIFPLSNNIKKQQSFGVQFGVHE